jgi:hypothetical protein
MYLDIFRPKSDKENLKSLQGYTIILSVIIMGTIVISEATTWISRGTERAIVMMMGFWMFCSAFQRFLQKQPNVVKLAVFLILLIVYWMGIFVYFTLKY